MGYITDEQEAEEALEWWGRYPDSIEALVSLSDDTASDEHGNVIGHVEWQYHPALKIMLAGSNGLVYSTRHAKQASGWHKFYVVDAEKETQRIFKRRLQASNKATKMNTPSNETGTTDMTNQAQMEKFIQAYQTALIWSQGEAFDENDELLGFYEDFEVSDELVADCEAQAASFFIKYKETIDKAVSSSFEYTYEQAGHDFALTRNGHGVGYWDRDLGTVGDELTEYAQKERSVYVYIGDDHLLYLD